MHKHKNKEIGGESMGWRGRGGTGSWPGRGPFSYLPPWERPGWLYGRGACWGLFSPYAKTYPYPLSTPTLKPEEETNILMEQRTFIEEQLKALQETLKKIEARLEEIKK